VLNDTCEPWTFEAQIEGLVSRISIRLDLAMLARATLVGSSSAEAATVMLAV